MDVGPQKRNGGVGRSPNECASTELTEPPKKAVPPGPGSPCPDDGGPENFIPISPRSSDFERRTEHDPKSRGIRKSVWDGAPCPVRECGRSTIGENL